MERRIPKSAMTRIMDVEEVTTSEDLRTAINAMINLPLQQLGLMDKFAEMVEEIQMNRLRKTGNN